MRKVYLISVSGGKDSQAAWLYMREHYASKKLQAYTCDTKWEHEDTYAHIDYLAAVLSPVDVVTSQKYDGFEDMCIKRKGFPTRQGRFCTHELKIIPAERYIKEWQARGYRVINVLGIRSDESVARSGEGVWQSIFMGDMPRFRKNEKGGIRPPSKNSLKKYYNKSNVVTKYQPIVRWTANQVLDYNEAQGTENNPLYKKGFARVGCMPCIMARVEEVGRLTDKQVERVLELEEAVAKVSRKPENDKPKFFQRTDNKGSLKSADWHHRKYKVNPLGLDLGCISPYGRCE